MAEVIRVMIVDDSPETRDSLRRLLGFSSRIEVSAEATNGAEALEQLSRGTTDVVLIDVNMPVMDGLTATRQISHRYQGVAVIVLSAQDDPEYKSGAMVAGAEHYLTKPVALNELIDTVETAYVNHIANRSSRPATQLCNGPDTALLP